MQRIIDGRTTKLGSNYKAFDYRKHKLSDTIIEHFGTPEKPFGVDLMFVEVHRSTKKVTHPDGKVEYVGIAPNPDGVKNLTIRMSAIYHTKPLPSTTDKLAFAVIVRSGENIVVEDFWSGPKPGGTNPYGFWRLQKPKSYPNSDILVFERGALNGIVRRAKLINAADGAIDTKGFNTQVYDSHADGCYRAFRFWDCGGTTDCSSTNPRADRIWHSLASARGDVVHTRFNFIGDRTKSDVQIDSGKAGRKIILVDPMKDGVPVKNLSELSITKNGTGKSVEVLLQLTETADLTGDIFWPSNLDNNGDDRVELRTIKTINAINKANGSDLKKGDVIVLKRTGAFPTGQNRSGLYVYDKE